MGDAPASEMSVAAPPLVDAAAQVASAVADTLAPPVTQLAAPQQPCGLRNDHAMSEDFPNVGDELRAASPLAGGVSFTEIPSEEPMEIDWAHWVDDGTTATATATARADALVLSSEESIDAANDERLVRAVVELQPFHADPRARTIAWDAVVELFTYIGGTRVASRTDVTKLLGVLTAALHDRAYELSPVLRDLVLTFNEHNCLAGYAKPLKGAFLKSFARRPHRLYSPRIQGTQPPDCMRTTTNR